jgi:hypothetical protein
MLICTVLSSCCDSSLSDISSDKCPLLHVNRVSVEETGCTMRTVVSSAVFLFDPILLGLHRLVRRHQAKLRKYLCHSF